MIPTLTTERLTLRAPRLDDFDAYAALRASDQMRDLGGPQSRAQAWTGFAALAGQWFLRGYGRWIVTRTGADVLLGVVGINHPDGWPEPEIGWSLTAEAEGHGIAHEAALATRRHAYGTLGWPTIVSLIAEDNARSIALARRLGCEADGVFESGSIGAMTIWRHPAPEAPRR